jgi:hypothetical protein
VQGFMSGGTAVWDLVARPSVRILRSYCDENGVPCLSA